MPAAPLLAAALLAAPPDPPGEPDKAGGPFAVESFEAVTPGEPVAGTDGGTGWAGPWAARPFTLGDQPDPARFPPRADTILGMADSLPHGDPAVRAAARGGSASAAALADGRGVGLISRPLKKQLGVPGQTVYLGVLLKAEGVLHRGAASGGFGVTVQFNLPGPGEPNWRRRLERESLDWFRAVGQDSNSLSLGKRLDVLAYRSVPNPNRERPMDRSEVWQLWRVGADQVPRAGGLPIPLSPANRLDPTRRYYVERGLHHEWAGAGYSQISSGVPIVPGKSTLIVCELSFPAARSPRRLAPLTRWAVWADPTLERPGLPQATGEVNRLKLESNKARRADNRRPVGKTTWVSLMQTGAVTVDELRFADTFAGAVGLPPGGRP